MHVEVITHAKELPDIRPQWEALYQKSQCSIFVSYPWIEHHINKQSDARIIVVKDNDELVFAMPLKEGVLSDKFSQTKVLEHLCKPYTDYHELLIHPDLTTMQEVREKVWAYIKANYPQFILKLEFPPPASATASFLSDVPDDYRRSVLGANYVFSNTSGDQGIESKLAKDIDRRKRRLEEKHQVRIEIRANADHALIDNILDLHKTQHGHSSFNAKTTREEVVLLLNNLSEQLVCSVLYVDDEMAAAAISFICNDTLFYYAPTVNEKYRTHGVGVMLFREIQNQLNKLGVSQISFLRGEEAYKIRLSNHSTLVEGVMMVPKALSSWQRSALVIWRARRTAEIFRARKKLNHSLLKDNSGGVAIVLANGLNGLGVVRALNDAGIKVFAFCPGSRDLAALSNAPFRTTIVPMDEHWEQVVFSHVQDIAKSHPVSIPIYACSDRAANFIEDFDAKFPRNICTLYPGNHLTQMLNDKQQELAFADKHNIPIPHSVWDIKDDRPFDKLTLPIIIKPKDFDGYKVINAKNVIAHKQSELEQFYETYGDKLDLFIAQELISGPDENLWVCNATFDKSHNLISAFTFRRLGTSPSHFGVTSFAYSENNPDVKRIVEKMGKAIGYVGPGMREFKFDDIKKEYFYIEINPRLGMCNWFDTQCNVSNVLVSYYLAKGKKVNPQLWQQTTGLYFLNGMGDFISRLEDKESLKSIFSRYFHISSENIVWSTWRKGDMKPTLVSCWGQVKMLTGRIVKQIKNKLVK